MNLSDDLHDSTLTTAPPSPHNHSAQEMSKVDTATGLHSSALPKSVDYWTSELASAPTQTRLRSGDRAKLELQTLKQLNHFGKPETLQDDSFRKEFLESRTPEQVGHYADPLSPLRERDVQALSQWFQRDDMYTIEADINQMLIQLLPEPCWDEETFDFLREFL